MAFKSGMQSYTSSISSLIIFSVSKPKTCFSALPNELHLIRKLKASETAQEPNQCTRVTKLPAAPFTFIGNIYNGKYIKVVS